MIRKLIVPALAAGLLAGCVSSYNYRAGQGDYYYGRPSVEYRYYGAPYGGYYGGFYGGYGYGYGGYPYRYYGSPYRYGYYGYPHYGYPHRPYRPYIPPPPRPGGHPPHHSGGGDYRPDNGKAPWRDLDGLRRSQQPRLQQPRASTGPEPARAGPPRTAPSSRPDGPRITPRRMNADRIQQQER